MLAVCGLLGCDRKGSELDLFNIVTYTPAPFSETLQAAMVNGRVNYPVIADGYTAPLEKYIELVATRGPETQRTLFFRPRHRAAYYVNVHNALVAKCWLDHGAGSGDPELEWDPAWADEKVYQVDGHTVSINDLAHRARTVASVSDPGVPSFPLIDFALCSGTVTGPPMPPRPFGDEFFEAELTNHIRAYINSPDVVEVVSDRVIVPPILETLADEIGDIVFFLDINVAETHEKKLELLQAARAGNVEYRRPSLRIDLPRDAQKRPDGGAE